MSSPDKESILLPEGVGIRCLCSVMVCLDVCGMFTAGALSRDIEKGEKPPVGRGSQTPDSRCLWLFLVLLPFTHYRGTRYRACREACLQPRERCVQAPVSGWVLDGRRSSPRTLVPCWGLVGLVVISKRNKKQENSLQPRTA